MSRPELRRIEGGGEIVDYLEGLLDAARAGQFEALAVASVHVDGELGIGYAYRDDMHRPWATIVASVTTLQHALLEEGF